MKEGAAGGGGGGGEGGREFKTGKKSLQTRLAQVLNHRPFHSIVLTQHDRYSVGRMFSLHLVPHCQDLTFSGGIFHQVL